MEFTLEHLAKDIYEWCKTNDLWGDNCIYYNGIALASWSQWNDQKGEKIANKLYLYRDKNPKDYFGGGNGSVLSMSFEGTLNHILNAYIKGWEKLDDEFCGLFEKYGLYFEMYDHWNGHAYTA